MDVCGAHMFCRVDLASARVLERYTYIGGWQFGFDMPSIISGMYVLCSSPCVCRAAFTMQMPTYWRIWESRWWWSEITDVLLLLLHSWSLQMYLVEYVSILYGWILAIFGECTSDTHVVAHIRHIVREYALTWWTLNNRQQTVKHPPQTRTQHSDRNFVFELLLRSELSVENIH